MDDLFIIYRINQDQDQNQFVVFVFIETDEPRFFSQYFSSDNKVMKFLLISYRKSDVIGRLE